MKFYFVINKSQENLSSLKRILDKDLVDLETYLALQVVYKDLKQRSNYTIIYLDTEAKNALKANGVRLLSASNERVETYIQEKVRGLKRKGFDPVLVLQQMDTATI